jgi:ATP-dependent RNA helicase DDX42
VNAQRAQLGIRVSGFDPPKPVATFEQCGFDAALMAVIKKAGYAAPTPVQAQALPAALSGRDILVHFISSLQKWPFPSKVPLKIRV